MIWSAASAREHDVECGVSRENMMWSAASAFLCWVLVICSVQLSSSQGDVGLPQHVTTTLAPSPYSIPSSPANTPDMTVLLSTANVDFTSIDMSVIETSRAESTITPITGCVSPPPLPNAHPTQIKQTYQVGDVAEYACNNGYQAEPTLSKARGSDKITAVCSENSNGWSNFSQTCQDRNECREQQLTRLCHHCENTAGSFICSCRNKYVMINGGCVESCGNPGVPENGIMSSTKDREGRFLLNAALYYTCKPGHDLVGNGTISCRLLPEKSFWNWTSSPPTCAPKDDGGGGLSDAEKTSIIVVCVLVGVLVIVAFGIFGVLRHTKTMYKTMAKRHSQVSLQSRLDSERARVIVDNRRSSRRNSRSERRTTAQQTRRASMEPSSHMITPQEGDVMFVSASSTKADLDDDFTDRSAPSLLDPAESSPYAPIGPGSGPLSREAPALPQRKVAMQNAPAQQISPLRRDPQMNAARQVMRMGSSSEDLLPTDDEGSTTSSDRTGQRDSVGSSADDNATTDYEDQP